MSANEPNEGILPTVATPSAQPAQPVVVPVGKYGLFGAAAADTLRQRVEEIAASQPAAILIDLRGAELLDSQGLNVLLDLRKRLANLTLGNVPQSIAEIFELAGAAEDLGIAAAERTEATRRGTQM
ncbi:STAS domain-containing protein [Anatilimnocola sp. NA78]|uniref:STAS domain-containing protein n=1 Tax=Anatilimnocola sp. NA78 TaxID=3415683 RepID=UPI003CE51644